MNGIDYRNQASHQASLLLVDVNRAQWGLKSPQLVGVPRMFTSEAEIANVRDPLNLIGIIPA